MTKLSIRFSGLFTLANGLRYTSHKVDPASRADLLFVDASTYRSRNCKHPPTLPPHQPILLLPGEAIDWSSPLALNMGTYRSFAFPGAKSAWCLWDLDGAIVKVVRVDGTATTPVTGGVDYDPTVPAGKEPATGEEGNLKWLLSLSGLYKSRPLSARTGLLKGPVTSPVLCRVELEGGRLEAASLFQDGGACLIFEAVDGNHASKPDLDQALAEELLWFHTFLSGTPGLALKLGGKVVTIPLAAGKDVEVFIQSEPADSPDTGGRSDHLLATYQLTEEIIPDDEKRIPAVVGIALRNAGGTHCPPDQLP